MVKPKGTSNTEHPESFDETFDEEFSEDETLLRLSDQTRRRQNSSFANEFDDNMEAENSGNDSEDGFESDEDIEDGNEEEEDEEEEEEEDDEEDDDGAEYEMDAFDLMDNLISAGARRTGSGNDEDNDRAEFLRAAMNSLPHRGAAGGDHSSFVDVIQRLMSGPIPGNRSNNEIEVLVNNLTQREDSYFILESLNELSERLLMMNGITAERVIPSDKLSNALVGIMKDPTLSEQLELQLVACRCLYNFLEVNQDFIHDVINNNAIEVLCQKLLEITFIDLTEQALQTLEMISKDPISHSQIIKHNGLSACLQYLDFLTVHSQRKCLQIVANCCSNALYDNFPMIDDIFENISNVVKTHSDSVVIENGWLSISRIIMTFKSYPDLLEKLFLTRSDLINELGQTIIVSSSKSSNTKELSKVPVNFSSCIGLIKSLIILASTSVDLSAILLSDIHIGEIIIKSINNYKNPLTEEISTESIMAAPTELIAQFLTLIGYLLPINYSPQETPFLKNSHDESTERMELNEKRLELYQDLIPAEYLKFVNDIWKLLIRSFQASMDFEVRRKVLINIFRIIKFYGQDNIKKIDNLGQVSELLASIINQNKTIIFKDFSTDIEMVDSDVEEAEHSKDPDNINKMHSNVVSLSCCLIMINLVKIDPKTFITLFEKEGLINDLGTICDTLRNGGLNDITDDYETVKPFSSSYNNRFTDIEFTKDYEYRLSSERIYNKLLHTTCEFEDFYGEWKSSGESSSSSTLQTLLDINDTLQKKDLSESSYIKMWNKLKHILENNVSSFEMISSGVIENLAKALQSEGVLYTTFLTSFFQDNGEELSPAAILIENLQSALNRSESFEVVSAGANSTNSRLPHSDNSQTAGMARQIKVRLVPENEDTKLPLSMQNMIVSIQAIATFQSIDTFLNNRLKFIDSLTNTLGHVSGQANYRENGQDGLEDELEDGQINEQTNEQDENLSIENIDETQIAPSRIEFLIHSEVIPNGTTIYGAIYRSLQSEPDEVIDSSKIWNSTHEITFRKTQDIGEERESILYLDSASDSNFDDTTINILKLLKILFKMNSLSTHLHLKPLPKDIFMNWKLTVKLNRQLEEPLIVASGTLPGWAIRITRQFPFIYPLETRILFLQSTSFGYSRLIHQWQIRTNQESDNSQRPLLGRPARRKVRILRKSIFPSAMKVLNLYGSTPGLLEVEYFGEAGSGLGPTLEFYSSVSKEFSKRKLRLWRDDNFHGDEDSFIDTKFGLFPSPLSTNQLKAEAGQKVLTHFSFLGKFIARALLDSRIIDFNFNPLFLELIEIFIDNPKNLYKIAAMTNLRSIDPVLADSMDYLRKYVNLFTGNPAKDRLVTVDNCTLEDLSLVFQLPGYPEYELVPNGENISITSKNVEAYIDKVIEHTLYNGVVSQIKAFMDGFSKVFPISSLIVFSPIELVDLFGSAEEDWSFETISSSINANHGYTKDSDAIKALINIMVDFNPIEKRSFLQFLTGAPKLPIGGFKSLKPELTVVRKVPEGDLKSDDYLPSVMTCANYLKLPAYSSEDVMRERILIAVNEGAGAFLLS